MKKLVIIGGGFAGAYCAQQLESHFNLTLIDTKNYYEFTPSVLRTLVEPNHISKIQVNHTQYLHHTTIIQAEVQDISSTEVIVKKEKYSYDYLIIATGSRYNSPFKEKNMIEASRAAELQQYAQALKKAQKILIVGGGIVGTELAAKIITTYPSKKLTIVHSQTELMERMPSKAQQYARRFLEKRRVTLLLPERMIKTQQGHYITNTRKRITADLVFLCTGIIPNCDSFKKFLTKQLDEKKFLRVNSSLQVQEHPNIFAAGDITSIAEEKLAQNAEKQAKIVVHNLLHLERKEPLEEYHSKPRAIVISLGTWKGIFSYKQFVLTSFIPAIIKQLIEWKTIRRYRQN